MRSKILLILVAIAIFVSCSKIAPISNTYQSPTIDKICIFADFENRDFRKSFEREIAQAFIGTNSEAFESYVLIPKNTPFTSYEVSKKLRDLNLKYFMYITRLDEGEGITQAEEIFTEFGELYGPEGKINSRPQIAAKIVTNSGELIWTSALAFDSDDKAEFPFKIDEYIRTLIVEMEKSRLITINQQ